MLSNKIIGANQLIEILDDNCGLALAKVDTGADESAIWATSVKETDGILSFVLFSPKSKHYTGEVHKTRDYRFISVKNSFGHKEYRYKVNLKIKINGSKYILPFNLSDRSHNKFPILIGKNFLQNRFVVDVSKGAEEVKDSPIVVLVTSVTGPIKEFFDKVSGDIESELLLVSYKDLEFKISKKGEPNIILPDGRDISCAKLVYFKSYSFYLEHALTVAKYLQYRHVSFFDIELANCVSRSKLSELFVLVTNGILVPATLVVTGVDKLDSYKKIAARMGSKFVIKDAISDRGKNNYFIEDSVSYIEAIARLKESGAKTLIIQEFIDNNGFTRVLLMGNKVSQIIKRSSVDHKDKLKSHLNKPYGSKNAVELQESDYDSKLVSLSRKSAIIMGRSVAGIDLIQDIITKKWYVLEVNYNPETIGGLNVDKKAKDLADLLNRKAK